MRYSIPLWVLPALTLAACSAGPSHHSATAEAAAEEKISANTVTAAADSVAFQNNIASLNSASRKRVRSADIQCRVNSVFDAVSTIERATRSVEGVIVSSNQYSQSRNDSYLPYTTDSVRQVRVYTTAADIQLKVPVASLDSVVHVITGLATFIDHRTLKDEDKTLDYLSNSLRNNVAASTVTADKKTSSVDAATYNDDKKVEKIDRQIRNLAIIDDVNNATISIALVQPDKADVQIVVNPDAVSRAGFGTELKMSVINGTEMLRNIFLFLVGIWPLVILGVLGYFTFRKIKKAA
ncbi:hypothetical protein [Chitinophaga sp. Cy-1792]|uniref:DUF4349 domain-containing protein n=1 Tax=Chitinophaga sp. Cy-1792 TaxID=2608339 RepID=UPI00141E846E|nr:hypothetical protein [Chitinophaga sp. Cy-1792]NIG56042.1 DUF4349 domain-containing protein [Chitinophaga sp. Cy-1792]